MRLATKRKGTFYLLQSDGGLYKYGVTRGDIKRRRQSAQRITGQKFAIIAQKQTVYPFRVETLFKWVVLNRVELWGNSVEFFSIRDGGITVRQLLVVFDHIRHDNLIEAERLSYES